MKRALCVLAASMLVAATAGQGRAAETIFHDSFDTYTSFPDGGWLGSMANSGLWMGDRGGGDKYVYSASYRDWGMPYHDVSIDWGASADMVKVTLTATVSSYGCRSWVGLTRPGSPAEETFYMGEYNMGGHWGIMWNGVAHPSAVPTDTAWHVLSLVIDKGFDVAGLYLDGGVEPIVTVTGLGADYLAVANVAMRIQKHGTVCAVADVLLTRELAVVPRLFHPGDANGDSVVDLQDFGALKDNFGATSGATWAQGDFNEDMSIDLQDFGILKDHFGHTDGDTPLAAVPEPTCLVLLSACGLAVFRRRR